MPGCSIANTREMNDSWTTQQVWQQVILSAACYLKKELFSQNPF